MKYIFLVFCLYLFSFEPLIEFRDLNTYKISNDSIIYWQKDLKLKWTDFKTSNKSDLRGAKSYTGIKLIPLSSQDKSTYLAVAYFLQSKSFSATEHSDYILKHEQLHFDITEIYARKIRKKIKLLESSSQDIDYLALHKKLFNESRELQKRYDRETNHSKDFIAQNRWNDFVEQELKNLKEYCL
jgi:hypothetical protein